MRRLIRRLLLLLSAISLIVCLATIALWARSYWRYSTGEVHFAMPARWPARVYMIEVESLHGRLRLSATVYEDDPDDPDPDSRIDKPRWLWFHFSDPPESLAGDLDVDHDSAQLLSRPWNTLLRAGYERESMHYNYGVFQWRKAIVPHWYFVAATGLPGAWATLLAGTQLVRWRRRRARLRCHLCAACGYDLRATPDRCPECGEGRPVMLR